MKTRSLALAALIATGCDMAPSDGQLRRAVDTLYRNSRYVCLPERCLFCELDPGPPFTPTTVEIIERGETLSRDNFRAFPVRVRVSGSCPPRYVPRQQLVGGVTQLSVTRDEFKRWRVTEAGFLGGTPVPD